MRISRRIKNNPLLRRARFMNPVDQLMFRIRLAKIDRKIKPLTCLAAATRNVVERFRSIDSRLPRAEQIEIRPIQDQHRRRTHEQIPHNSDCAPRKEKHTSMHVMQRKPKCARHAGMRLLGFSLNLYELVSFIKKYIAIHRANKLTRRHIKPKNLNPTQHKKIVQPTPDHPGACRPKPGHIACTDIISECFAVSRRLAPRRQPEGDL